jgi:hypothetical protein
VAKKKKSKAQAGSETLGSIAESLGTLLGSAEKQWRAWQGPRDAVVKAVTDVRDRAAALLSEIGAAKDAASDKGSKKGKKKKDKKAKRDKKSKKDKKAKAAEAATKGADKTEKKKSKAGKTGRKAGQRKKTGTRTRTAGPAPAAPADDAPAATPTADGLP